MKITNKYDLPESLVRAIQNDPYNSGDCDISTTRLISPPQVVALQKRHGEKSEEDVSEGIWRLIGQSVHVLVERASVGIDVISEKRYSQEVEGWKLSGQVDLIENGNLVDWKVTSVWTYIYGSRMLEWEQQANVNRWLAEKNGVHIQTAENYLILRDWNKTDSMKKPGYPPVQIVRVTLPIWSMEIAEDYIRDRIRLHQGAQKASDADLSHKFACGIDDRWYNAKTKKFIRCDSYCSVSDFCHQNKREVTVI